MSGFNDFEGCLDDAYHEGRIPIDEPGSACEQLEEVDSARIRSLTNDETRRLVDACFLDFRALVIGRLMTSFRLWRSAALGAKD